MTSNGTVLQNAFDSTWGAASGVITKVGQLNPIQSDRFIDYVFDQTFFTGNSRIIRMNAPSMRIGKTDMGVKPLRPATRGVDPGVTTTASVTEITLQTQEVIAEARILDDELEDNTERGSFMDHFMRMLGIRIGNQLELAYLEGVSTAGSPVAVDINQLFNGYRYRIVNSGGHEVDGTTVGGYSDRYITTPKLSRAIKVIPAKYRTNRLDYRFIVSPNIYQDFIDLVGNRATPFGDQAYKAAGYEPNLPVPNSTLGWGATPIAVAPLLPEDLFVAKVSGLSTTVSSGGAAAASTVVVASVAGLVVGDAVKFGTGASAESKTITDITGSTLTVDTPFAYARTGSQAAVQGTLTGSYVLCTHYQNLLVGIQRDIRIELERRARERATYAVVTMRVDCQMENPDAASVLSGLAVKP